MGVLTGGTNFVRVTILGGVSCRVLGCTVMKRKEGKDEKSSKVIDVRAQHRC